MTVLAVRNGEIVRTSERWVIGFDPVYSPEELDYRQGRFVVMLLTRADQDGRVRLTPPRPPYPPEAVVEEDECARVRRAWDDHWRTLWWGITENLIRPLDKTFEWFQVNPDEILVVHPVLMDAARDRFRRSILQGEAGRTILRA